MRTHSFVFPCPETKEKLPDGCFLARGSQGPGGGQGALPPLPFLSASSLSLSPLSLSLLSPSSLSLSLSLENAFLKGHEALRPLKSPAVQLAILNVW